MQEQDNGQPLFTILSIFASEFDYLEWFRHTMIEQFFPRQEEGSEKN